MAFGVVLDEGVCVWVWALAVNEVFESKVRENPPAYMPNDERCDVISRGSWEFIFSDKSDENPSENHVRAVIPFSLILWLVYDYGRD